MISPSAIDKYINEFSFASPLIKGTRLYNLGNIRGISIDSHNQLIEMQVKGTRIYSQLINYSRREIQTSCNCPYDYGGICKHSIAALLYLKKYIADNPNVLMNTRKISTKTIVKREHNTSDWYIFSTLDNLSYPTLRSHFLSTNSRRAELYQSNYKDINFLSYTQGIMTFTLYTRNLENYDVSFKYENGNFLTNCSCKISTIGFCEHQTTVLILMLNSFNEDFFNKLIPTERIKIEQNTLKNYGFPETTNFYDFFTFNLDETGLVPLPYGKGKGLVPIETNELSSPFEFMNIENQLLEKFEQMEAKSKFSIGFAFLFSPKNQNELQIELLPFVGKRNKANTELLSNFSFFNEKVSHKNIALNPETEKLISLAKQTDEDIKNEIISHKTYQANDETTFLLESIKYYIPIYNNIVPKLIKEPYIYLLSRYNLSKRNMERVTVSDKKININFKLSSDNELIKLEPRLEINGKSYALNSSKTKILSPLFVKYANTLIYINSLQDAMLLMQNNKQLLYKSPINSAFDFFDKYVIPISKHYNINLKSSIFNTKITDTIITSKQIYISELSNFILFQPVVVYENWRVNILKKGTELSRNNNTVTVIERDLVNENQFNELIKSLHPKFEKQFPDEFYFLGNDEMIEKDWFYDAFDKLRKEGIEIFGLNDLKKFTYSPFKAKVSINIASGQNWFDVDLSVKFGDYEVSISDIKKAVLRKDKFIKLDNGKTGILAEEWLTKFENYFRHGQIKKGEIKISKLKFSLIDELFDAQNYSEILYEIEDKKRKLKSFKEIKSIKIPSEIKGKLRDYQIFGYNWMNFLDEFSWGGILADDMGLGKTLQVITFLQFQVKKSDLPNLIVVPTTLLFNWQKELDKFAPSLSVHFHYGIDRKKDPNSFKNTNLIITSYGIVMNDIDFFRKVKFNYAILDESQAIKNPSSKRFKAVNLIKAQNKIAMTGTPIENNTFDLYAQMEFVNPGFLGSQAHFKENYSTPIDKDQDPKRAAELQKIINPFVLRRTKEQVAKELPEKTEDIIYCNMETEQRKVYEAFRNKYRNFLMNKIEEDGLGKSKMYVLEGLTKLRQICDSPQLLPGEEDFGTNSIKIKEIIRHIKEKTANHKILVFSQFVKMLRIIETKIKDSAIQYEYLDGQSTKKARQKSVENFQDNEQVRVFLISLKAGGTGINLTEADYVYIVDPWWNPAVENQAIDRCHRIGQSKKVIAYRMICKDTIEEKIMEYQAKKKKIASDIISTDESFVKNLTAQDINSLFN